MTGRGFTARLALLTLLRSANAAVPPLAHPSPTPHPAATVTASSIDTVRATIAAAAEGVLYVSESEASFTVVALPGVATTPATFGVADARRAFGITEAVPVSMRTLDDFFRPLVEDVDPADAAAQRSVPRARALREAIRASAPGAVVFRVGDGPRVRYIVAGVAPGAGGAVVGVETVGFET